MQNNNNKSNNNTTPQHDNNNNNSNNNNNNNKQRKKTARPNVNNFQYLFEDKKIGMTTSELSAYLNYTKRTIIEYVHRGVIPPSCYIKRNTKGKNSKLSFIKEEIDKLYYPEEYEKTIKRKEDKEKRVKEIENNMNNLGESIINSYNSMNNEN